ncbi:hypothetical protein [Rathayibacter sp. VKM Ac-2926]|uniref:hypothetical protein n=1 Tax=Rathayibacter sp. VKM Ac-2926 TaxID=2929477 RepID=UPI001FB51187|nr:hypothetical protein [Rathayibacter sp. VKM Ac-2926]MCJ1705813.1 hypothetical protein [Rathayibacter sp. VKM Ac-2926]
MPIRPSQVEAARLRVRILRDRGDTPDTRLLALANYVIPLESAQDEESADATLIELYGPEQGGLMAAAAPAVVSLTDRREAREIREKAARHIDKEALADGEEEALTEALDATDFAASRHANKPN